MSDNEGAEVEAAPDDADDETVDDDLLERVEESDPEELAREIRALRERADEAETRVEELEAERDDLESKLKRKQAEFQNYKKRQEKRREQERQRATEDLVERLLETRDNLVRALDQEAGTDIRDGVEVTLRGFEEVLAQESVEAIEPEPGEETDPQRHEVLMRVESDQPEDTVADLHRPGYEMAGKVLRAAQVTVSEGSDDAADDASDE